MVAARCAVKVWQNFLTVAIPAARSVRDSAKMFRRHAHACAIAQISIAIHASLVRCFARLGCAVMLCVPCTVRLSGYLELAVLRDSVRLMVMRSRARMRRRHRHTM